MLVTAFCGITILILYYSGKAEEGVILVVRDELDPMTGLLEPYAGGAVRQFTPIQLPRELPGFDGIALVYGTQAAYMHRTGSDGYIPLYSAMVVLAVNRAMNPGHSIRSWKSLLESDAVVLIPHHGTEAGRLASIAMARALGAKEGDIRPAINVWAALKAQNRLNSQQEYLYKNSEYTYKADSLKKFDAVVMWDYQARMLKRTSDNWDIIIPADGTLTVDCGMVYGHLSDTDEILNRTKQFLLSEDGRNALKNAGFSKLAETEDLSAWSWARLTCNPVFRRLVNREKLYSPASMLERLVLQVFTLFLFCIATRIVLRRVPKGLYRTSSLFTLLFLVLWMLIGIVKILTYDSTVVRYCWYLTYIPRHMMPLGWYCMNRVNHSGSLPRRRIMMLLIAAAVLLSAFVVTNDFHRQVFAFSSADPAEWSKSYSTRWGYYLSTIWSFSQAIAGIMLLFSGARTQRQKRQFIYADAAFILLLAYQALYIAGFRYILDLDIPTTVSVTILIFMLAAQRERFMDASLLAMPIFRKSPYAIAVYDSTQKPVFLNTAMNGILNMNPGILDSIHENPEAAVMIEMGDRFFQTRFHRLENGCAHVVEDITEIRNLELALQDTCRRLKAVQELLTRDVEEAPDLTAKIELERYRQHMNRLFEGKIADARMCLQTHEQAPCLNDPSCENRRIRLHIHICQRRLRFLLRSLEFHPAFPAELVERYVAGLAEDAGRLGLDIAFTGSVWGEGPSGGVEALLECVDKILLYTFELPGSSAILRLETNGKEMLLRIFLSCEDTGNLSSNNLISEDIIQSVERSGGRMSRENEEDGLLVLLFLPCREVRHELV